MEFLKSGRVLNNRHGRVRSAGVPEAKRVGMILGALTFAASLVILPTPAQAASGPGPEAAAIDGAALCAQGKAKALSMMLLASGRTEPTANQRAYDARYYALQLNVHPTTKSIDGTAIIRVTVIDGPLAHLDLDLQEAMIITSVREGDATLHVSRDRGVARVDLTRPYQTGEDITISIDYYGAPITAAFHFDAVATLPMIWTLSAPYGARTWWPCKDYPEDKADSVDIRISIPTPLRPVCNGTLRSSRLENGIVSAWWRERHPISTYLVSLAAHPYAFYSDWYHPQPGLDQSGSGKAAPDSMEIQFYNFVSSQASVRAVQAKVKDMIAGFAERFGEYPFLDEKYGHAEFLFSGGMENQTITGLGSNAYSESVIAHELGHQWWGDAVTCADYHDIWLNEGFGTYCEALWAEISSGAPAYRAKMDFTANYGPGTVYVDDVGDGSRIYDQQLSYYKGSWVVHMLRHVVGDGNFFRSLKEYRRRYEGGAVTTDSLRIVAEEISGRDLQPFFRQWIRGERYPVYRYDWSSEASGGGWDLTVRLRQMQDWQLFTMPVDIRVTTSGGSQTLVLENSSADTTYVLHLDHIPREVTLDPDRWILCRIMDPLAQPSLSKPVLLVNGMSWNSPAPAADEIRRTYEAASFTGGSAYDFWDCFGAPVDGYPASLPQPLGHGAVPPEVLGAYQSVVWLSNNFGGDVQSWNDTPIHAYLEAGGNVILMTRDAGNFLSAPFRRYLGIEWAGTDTIYDCAATYSGLSDLHPIGLQSVISHFVPTLGSESTLLYKSTEGHYPEWGLGVVREPAAGGIHRAEGGRFILLNGRPYRWDADELSANLYILLNRFMPQRLTGQTSLSLSVAMPNPIRMEGNIRFYLPSPSPARLTIWDVTGRRIAMLRDGPSPAGWNGERWNTRDDEGHKVPGGVYFMRVEAAGREVKGKVVVMR
jgi:aminopeptidase N